MYYVIYVKFMLKDIENLAKIHEKKMRIYVKGHRKKYVFLFKENA